MPDLLSAVFPSVIATLIAAGIVIGALGVASPGGRLLPVPVKNKRPRR